MTEQKDHITAALDQIGAAWAVTKNKVVLPNDPMEDQVTNRATYHIHPDKAEPRAEYIQRFSSLKELEQWIRDQRPPRRRVNITYKDWEVRSNITLAPEEKKELRRRYGSLQAAIEQLVKQELKS